MRGGFKGVGRGVRFRGGDSEFEFHGAADIVDGVGEEFVVEDVVVDGVPYATADDADGKSEGRDRGDEILEKVAKVSFFGLDGLC